MKRRSFIKSILGFLGLGGMASTAAATPMPSDSHAKAFARERERLGDRWVYRHEPGCGSVAFFLDEYPGPGAYLTRGYDRLGNRIPAGSKIACSTCGGSIGWPDRANLEPWIGYLPNKARELR